uniref:N-acetyltransferase domain-containing protein n=1 Tax=Eutreptiella gymnastica TaxID=73025 RepID=A0A7S1IPV3_9EUGL
MALVSVPNAATTFDLTILPDDFRQFSPSIGSYPVIVCHKRHVDSDEESTPKRRKIDDSDEDSESAAALTSLHSCTWGWDNDMDIFTTLTLEICTPSDSLSSVPDLSPLGSEEEELDEEDSDEDEDEEPTEAQKIEWHGGDEFLEYLMVNTQDACVLTDMLHDTCANEIQQLSRYNPGYHPRMAFVDLVEPRCRYVTLRVSGHIAGVATVHPEHTGLPGFSLITCFMIRHEFRSQGLGSTLLEAVHAQVQASGPQAMAMLQPCSPGLAGQQVTWSSQHFKNWVAKKGYNAIDWDSPHPLAACSRLQLVLNGINYRDYTFLTYEARGQPPRCEDGALLSHYQCLKQMVMMGWHTEMQNISQMRELDRLQSTTIAMECRSSLEEQGGVSR